MGGCQAVPTANCGENMHCTYIICPQWQVQSFAANAPLEVRHYLPHKAEDAEPLHDWALTTLLDDIRVCTWGSKPSKQHGLEDGKLSWDPLSICGTPTYPLLSPSRCGGRRRARRWRS